MSALSDLLNRHFDTKYGGTSNRRISEMAGVSRGTIDNYRNGTHPARPSEEVLRAFHDLLGIPMEQLRAAADLPPGEEEPYLPPSEANLLNSRQRRALDELIRSFVATKEAHREDQGTQDPPSNPPTDGETRPSGTPMKRADIAWLDDHRAPDVDDMLDRVTEDAQRSDQATPTNWQDVDPDRLASRRSDPREQGDDTE
ncbi:helix-turn-helix domain-containing protein [Dietzia aurantiaca]|uniref:helix-turn-helix domain-containing protein n=1 Tax=Dietzia aurantiaca TaxID=983873 RepID=UPI001E59535A|nr:helix-turn-helix transcriptional regulator [Dietzia aurantiaca]MCD2263257.1 helix-turn-helix domain-containing protein [Dietzia aurantiaca]